MEASKFTGEQLCILENVKHCGGEPEQAANMHMNRLSFMLKWWAEAVAFMGVVYVRPLPEAISTCRVYFCTVVEQPAVDGRSIAAVTNKK